MIYFWWFTGCVLSQKNANSFAHFFGENVLKIITLNPWSRCVHTFRRRSAMMRNEELESISVLAALTLTSQNWLRFYRCKPLGDVVDFEFGQSSSWQTCSACPPHSQEIPEKCCHAKSVKNDWLSEFEPLHINYCRYCVQLYFDFTTTVHDMMKILMWL
jgi:hypothetical protein